MSPSLLPSFLTSPLSLFYLLGVYVHVCVCRHMCAHIDFREEPVVVLARLSTSFRRSLIGLMLLSDARVTDQYSQGLLLSLALLPGHTHNCKTLWHFDLGTEFRSLCLQGRSLLTETAPPPRSYLSSWGTSLWGLCVLGKLSTTGSQLLNLSCVKTRPSNVLWLGNTNQGINICG